MAFKVTSDSFKDGDYLSKDFVMSADFGFGCAGGNKSPHLRWSGAPEGTESFAITCYDPDAPTGSGFWHWLIVNIPAEVYRARGLARQPAAACCRPERCNSALDCGETRLSPVRAQPEGDHPHRYTASRIRGRQRKA